MSGHPWGTKKCPELELATYMYENVKTQSLYESLIKGGFDQVVINRAVHL